MKNTFENNMLTVYLQGNVDSNNASAVQQEIDELVEQHPGCQLEIDCQELVYISSAGLRTILKFKKQFKDLKLVNVTREIYEIFDMTGFTEMMEISKEYRQMSIEGCEVIGEGSNGIVYRLNGDTIIKVYKNNDALEDIKRERELARTALVLGVNTAIPYDVVKVGNKYGSVFELLSASSITKLIKTEPENIDKYLTIFVNFLKDIHATPVKSGVLPSEKQTALHWVEYLKGHIDEKHYDKLYRLVNEVPESVYMLHGDYHTNNVHYANGETVLIDMDTLACGNPIFELACIFNAYVGFGIVDSASIEEFLKIDKKTAEYIWEKTLQLYLDTDDKAKIEQVENKAKVIGFTRVLRRTLKREPENQKLIDASRNELLTALDKVNELTF